MPKIQFRPFRVILPNFNYSRIILHLYRTLSLQVSELFDQAEEINFYWEQAIDFYGLNNEFVSAQYKGVLGHSKCIFLSMGDLLPPVQFSGRDLYNANLQIRKKRIAIAFSREQLEELYSYEGSIHS